MALTVTDFLVNYPEFVDAPTSLVQAKLTEAIAMVPDLVWGGSGPGQPNSLTQQGTFLYCAQFLALSPYARSMKLSSDNGSTIYDGRIANLKRIVASGYRSL